MYNVKFQPCIDLHGGQVKQIVGGTLSTRKAELRTNHVSEFSAGHFARLYREHNLLGAHMIMLGPGNEDPAREALREWPGGLQVGGGINAENAKEWIDAGADKVVVTSYLFPNSKFSQTRLEELLSALENKTSNLVIDLSCRKQGDRWIVAMNKWQTLTDTELNQKLIAHLGHYCSEFLIHAADNEGLQAGIDEELVRNLAEWSPRAVEVTYAGGGRGIADLQLVHELSKGRVHLTIGSALDIFGGKEVTLAECIQWNQYH